MNKIRIAYSDRGREHARGNTHHVVGLLTAPLTARRPCRDDRSGRKDHGDATHREFDFLDKSECAMEISMWCQWYDDIHSHFGVNYQRGSGGEVHMYRLVLKRAWS